jgi:hypothetical protein
MNHAKIEAEPRVTRAAEFRAACARTVPFSHLAGVAGVVEVLGNPTFHVLTNWNAAFQQPAANPFPLHPKKADLGFCIMVSTS